MIPGAAVLGLLSLIGEPLYIIQTEVGTLAMVVVEKVGDRAGCLEV